MDAYFLFENSSPKFLNISNTYIFRFYPCLCIVNKMNTEITTLIYIIREQKVLLDSDLAYLYGLQTKQLNQAVKRQLKRFPSDFMFRLTKEEYNSLRSQIVTSKDKGGRRYPPYAFTELGVAMLSSILNTQKAIDINIHIMRTFVQLRSSQLNHNLEVRLTNLEKGTVRLFKEIFEKLEHLQSEDKSSNKRKKSV